MGRTAFRLGGNPAPGPDPVTKSRSGSASFVLALLSLIPALLALPTERAVAHGRSVSYSSWEITPSGAQVSLRLKLLELSRLGPEALPPGTAGRTAPAGAPDLPARAFPRELVMLADGKVCRPDGQARRMPDAPGWIRYAWDVRCPAQPARLAIRSQLLLAVAPSHMHFARARWTGEPTGSRAAGSEADTPRRPTDTPEPGRVLEKVLTEADPEFVLMAPERAEAVGPIASRFLDYLALGIEHILSGWDHLAFVFGLLLLARRLGEVARLITGFTLAHSLTLALAVLEVVHPRAAAVEAVIAFSVALVAIEKGWLAGGKPNVVPVVVVLALAALALASAAGTTAFTPTTVFGLLVFTTCYFALVAHSDSSWLRISLTFAFGLVHGFGFAGILVEMTLPTDRLVPALLGFNLGVEIGQIGVVLVLWPLFLLARNAHGRRVFDAVPALPRLSRITGEIAAAALCGLGLYWFALRAFSA